MVDSKVKTNYLQTPLSYLDLDSNKRELIQLMHEYEKEEEIYSNELKSFVAKVKENGITIEKNLSIDEECDTVFSDFSKELKEIELRMISFDKLIKESSIDCYETKILEYGNLKTKLGAFLEIAEIYSSLNNDVIDLNLSKHYKNYAIKLARMKNLVDTFNNKSDGTLGKEFENQFIEKLEKELFEREDSFLIILMRHFRNIINYTKFQEDSSTKFEIRVKKENNHLENILSSLYQLENLDIQMKDFVKFLKEMIELGAKVFSTSDQLFIEETDSEYVIKFTYNMKSKNKKLDIHSKYNFFNILFSMINKVFHNIVIDDSTNSTFTFMEFLGSKIGDNVVNLLKTQYLIPLLPCDISDISKFDCILKNGMEIINVLSKENFIKPETDYLNDFVANLEKLCIEKKCLKVSLDSKTLLLSSMEKTKSIETIINEIKDIDMYTSFPLTTDIKFDILHQIILSFGKKQKYCISYTLEKIMDLVEGLGNETDNLDDISKNIISRNGNNIIQMVLILFPRVHRKTIQSNFEMGALFYNNYFYILYCFFKFHFIDKSKEFVDIVTKLRILANDAIMNHSDILVSQISSKLYGGFSDLENSVSLNYFAIFQKLPAFGLYLKKEAKKLYNLFPIIMYQDIVTDITKRCLKYIAKIFMSISDFRSDQCELITQNVNDLFLICDEIFMKISPDESVKNRCFVEYYRLYEIIFCLNHSLDEIAMRYCEDEYTSEFLEKCELKSLIRAIFQNTDKRAEILKKL
uniref:Centromere/kinetochore protein zw10 homolog n=1 Tax=Strongyloides papillosus TaxID=174720 RepID=A0A0N5BVR8_STREA